MPNPSERYRRKNIRCTVTNESRWCFTDYAKVNINLFCTSMADVLDFPVFTKADGTANHAVTTKIVGNCRSLIWRFNGHELRRIMRGTATNSNHHLNPFGYHGFQPIEGIEVRIGHIYNCFWLFFSIIFHQIPRYFHSHNRIALVRVSGFCDQVGALIRQARGQPIQGRSRDDPDVQVCYSMLLCLHF